MQEPRATQELRELPVDLIEPGPSQPRQHFDEEDLRELAGSMSERGVLQPVLVRPGADDCYELVAGERRWRAAKLAGLVSIPALVSRYDDLAALEVGLIENVARKDLNPVEEARAYEVLVEELGLTYQQIGDRVGSNKITTPLLPGPLEGGVYLASPQSLREGPAENPFASLIAVYVVAREPVSGVLVELAGTLTPNPATGQLTASFEETPQLPFEDIELDFLGGQRAPLSTPARCGSYTTQATFVPWAATLQGGTSSSSDAAALTVHASSTFAIDSGPNGSPCPGVSLPFAPSQAAQTTSVEAGAFTPLTASVGRTDGQQAIRSLRLKLPPGVSGVLAGVKPCGEAQANAGTCPSESQIGETTFSVGLGGEPYTISGGKVYLTERYEGAPFGLALVTPARVGPFELLEGRPIVVRARLEIDPQTAALTIATGLIPQIIEGIPLQLKHLNIAIDGTGGKSNFILNPTSCAPMKIEATVGGSEGATAVAPVPFQVANCASLKFAPKLTASTQAKTSRAAGASLSVKLTYPAGSSGSRAAGQASYPAGSGSQAVGMEAHPPANIAALKVDLPKALPARLKTLRQACLARIFQANPAACPAGSIVGRARVLTPILPVALEGPAYFVGRGSERFPGLVVVLSGDGVRLNLAGTTYIDAKTDLTSLTFKTVPDIPVSSLELTLPEGPHSALAASAALCKRKLAMPTAFVGQNGAEIHESTKVGVIGCPPARPPSRPKVRKSKRRSKRK
jgi:ParB/RepB/Spo0J family partition protein